MPIRLNLLELLDVSDDQYSSLVLRLSVASSLCTIFVYNLVADLLVIGRSPEVSLLLFLWFLFEH